MSEPIVAVLEQLRAQSGALAVCWSGPRRRIALPEGGRLAWDAGLDPLGSTVPARGRGPGGDRTAVGRSAGAPPGPAPRPASSEGAGVARFGPRTLGRWPRLAALGARFVAVRSGRLPGGEGARLALASAGGLGLSDEALEASFTALAALEEERAAAERVRRRGGLAELGRAAAGTAHDLRNALSTALLELDALGAEAGQADGGQRARRALQGALAGARDLARDFLDGRGEPGGAERRPVELVGLLRRELARHPEGSLLLELPDTGGTPESPIHAAGRRDLLARVVSNLVSNARAASPRGAPVELALRTGAPGLELSVADVGRGMDQAGLDAYLEPGATRSGSGFGTASVRDCLARMGAELFIESRPGEGTRCLVRLERAPSPGAPSALVLDPDPIARWSWREVFERAGLQALDTAGAAGARAWIEGTRPAVVLVPRAVAGSAAVRRAAEAFGATVVETGVEPDASGERDPGAAHSPRLPRVANRASGELLERLLAAAAPAARA